MSGAFTKEGDAADDFPERPLGDLPNYVTASGLNALREAVAALLVKRAQADEKKLIDRDLRYFQARVESAILVEHKAPPPDVRFGAYVTVNETEYRLVGVDEADPSKGLVAWSSPLAAALIGKKPGDATDFGTISALRY